MLSAKAAPAGWGSRNWWGRTGHTALGTPSDRTEGQKHALMLVIAWHMPSRQGTGPEAQADCPVLTSGPEMSLQQCQAQSYIKIQMSGLPWKESRAPGLWSQSPLAVKSISLPPRLLFFLGPWLGASSQTCPFRARAEYSILSLFYSLMFLLCKDNRYSMRLQLNSEKSGKKYQNFFKSEKTTRSLHPAP